MKVRSFSRRRDLPAGLSDHTDYVDSGDSKAPSPVRRLRGLTVAAGPLFLVLGGITLVSLPLAFHVPATARVVGGNFPVNAGATDLRDVSSHNSPNLIQNPRNGANLVIANRIDTPGFSCALHVSLDGGVSWSQTPIPIPAGEEAKCYGPDVAFTPGGALYMSFVTLQGDNNIPKAVWTTSSTDGGRTLTAPTRATGPLAFQTRLTADPAREGSLYLTWLQAADTATLGFPETGYPIQISVSGDGGASWTPPQRVSSARRARVVSPTTVAGPHGALYVLYLDLGEDRLDYEGAHEGKGGDPYQGTWELVLARSSDTGKGWSESLVQKPLVPSERFIVFLPPSPSLAVDASSGNVYAAFHDGKFEGSDVLVWKSSDNGKNFSSSVRVNDTAPEDKTSQYLPKVSVAPDGRVDVVYYDRRADPKNIMNEVSFHSSFDGVQTFTPRLRLTDIPFDSRVGFATERGLPDLGSRLGMISAEDRALAVWTDTRAGTTLSKKQDLVRAYVDIEEPETLPPGMEAGLRYGGALLAMTGLAWLGLRISRSTEERK